MRSPLRRRALISLCAFFVLIALLTLTCNLAMLHRARGRILTADEVSGDWDCILVLGTGIAKDGTPLARLSDRLQTGCSLYEAGAAPLLLMSGDRQGDHYDEVGAMEAFALEAGVPQTAIQKDGTGFSTYESIRNLWRLFGEDVRVLIVSQRYHLARALWIADSFGIEAIGVAADAQPYTGMLYRNLREVAARVKDVFFCLQPKK